MSRLRTLTALLAVVLLATAVFGAGVASGGDDPAGERYRAYASVRERLKSCSLDRTWRHLGTSARRRCVRLRRQYILYSVNGESSQYFFYCRRAARRCPPAPDGVRSTRARIPRGATIFR